MRVSSHAAVVLVALLPLAATALMAWGSEDPVIPAGTEGAGAAPALELLTERAQVTDPDARHSEFYVVGHPSDPRTLAMAVINSDDPNGGRTCGVHLTRDGGRTWDDITPPAWLHWGVVYDPWLTWTADGDLHALCIDNGEPDGPLVYARTRDLGATWFTQSVRGGGGDKSVLGHAADGSLYACSAKGERIAISISRDRGDTWTTTDLAGMGNMCNGMFETSDGAMHALWESEESWPYDVPIGFLTSRDRGATWERSDVAVVHSHYGNDPACKAARGLFDPSEDPGFTVAFGCGGATGLAREDLPSFTSPIVAVSPVTSTILVAYHDFQPDQTYVLKLLRSTDMGASFHGIATPPGTEPCGVDCHMSRPVPGFDAQGRLGLQWRRGNTVTGHDILFSASLDEGETWIEPVTLGRQGPAESMFHPRSLAPNAERLANGAVAFATDPEADPVRYAGQSLFLSAVDGVNGDGAHYWGMGATDEGFVAMWLDGAGNGTPQVWARVVRVVE